MEAVASDRNGPLSDANFRAVEVAWLQDHSAELAERYPGEWLAIDGPQLVAHAEDLTTLLQQAAASGHPNPFITAAPAVDTPRYFAG